MTRLFAGTPFDRPPTCERCGALEVECRCPPPARELVPPEKQKARIHVQKRAKGKIVTTITGLRAAENDLPELLTYLKQSCGTGGTLDGDQLELQGDRQARVRELLSGRGYRVA